MLIESSFNHSVGFKIFAPLGSYYQFHQGHTNQDPTLFVRGIFPGSADVSREPVPIQKAVFPCVSCPVSRQSLWSLGDDVSTVSTVSIIGETSQKENKDWRTGMAQSDRRVASGFLKCLHPSPAILLAFTLVPSQNGRLAHARTTEGAYLKVVVGHTQHFVITSCVSSEFITAVEHFGCFKLEGRKILHIYIYVCVRGSASGYVYLSIYLSIYLILYILSCLILSILGNVPQDRSLEDMVPPCWLDLSPRFTKHKTQTLSWPSLSGFAVTAFMHFFTCLHAFEEI